jgi:tryptophan synthase beta chain
MKKNGYYGKYGGKFIPEILVPAFNELQDAFDCIKKDTEFWNEYILTLKNYSGRPTPLTFADRLTKYFDKAKIYVKREDLNHSGAHKINNAMGQALLAKRMGKKRVIAETGAGQHGIATAIVAAKLGLEATIYMGKKDVERQYSNVFWMKQLGAKVIPVEYGSMTLKDAINAALRDWVENFETTHYLLGTASGAAPYPEMVTFFQSVIGNEVKKQIVEMTRQLPTHIFACVGGGSNAMGIFYPFLEEQTVQLIGVEAGGKGEFSKQHASRLAYNQADVGIAQGYKSYFLQNKDGQMQDTYSISAGLDYVGISPILADLFEKNRVIMKAATDQEVLASLQIIMKQEGLIPALESTHAFAGAFNMIEESSKHDIFVINMSGRGDKDIFNVAEGVNDIEWKRFITRKAKQYK